MQDFLVFHAKILVILGFVVENSKNFLGYLSTILKNLANLAKMNYQDFGKKSQKSKIFLGEKSKIFLPSHAKILDILGFSAKKSKKFLGFISAILKNLAKSSEPCQELLPRSWQEMSKIQEISWQEIQDAKHWEEIFKPYIGARDYEKLYKFWKKSHFLSFFVFLLIVL